VARNVLTSFVKAASLYTDKIEGESFQGGGRDRVGLARSGAKKKRFLGEMPSGPRIKSGALFS